MADTGDQPGKEQLALEAPRASSDGTTTTKIDVSSGEAVSMYDRLGPFVVNSDNTLSRIANWQEMGEAERARVLRVLGKRNQLRLSDAKEKLGAAEGEGEGGKDASSST